MSAIHAALPRTALAALAGLIMSVSASAATPADPFAGAAPTSITIRVAAAPATPREAEGLAIRIRAAASTVCGGDVDPVVRTSDLFAKCREAAIDRALRGVNAPVLARALGRSPQQLASDPR